MTLQEQKLTRKYNTTQGEINNALLIIGKIIMIRNVSTDSNIPDNNVWEITTEEIQ